MKKLLLSTAAICGLAVAASPAYADIDLELGGYFKGYGAYVDQDEQLGGGPDATNDLDFIRDTEIHIGGETTLENGLTVGAHIEADVDGTTGVGSNDSFEVDESYVYFSGGWGRVNFGDEDGAAYLLQVAAPSADSNIDGIRQYVQPVNYGVLLTTADQTALGGVDPVATNGGLDYDMDPSGKSTKLTYLTPIVNGFQAGVTYSPDTDGADDLEGIGDDDVAGAIGATYEVAARYEGQFQNVGVILGAGYSHGDLEAALAGSDDREVWNAGIDLDFGPFGLGVVYRDDNGAANAATNDDEKTLVVGADYTTGAFKIGASYYDQDNTYAIDDLDTKRYSGGVTYTYGPGMSFRGSIGYVEHESDTVLTNDVEATYVTLGTQINF